MIMNDYQQLVTEHFDITDSTTRKTIIALEDTEQTQLLSALTNALYDKIVSKVDSIDFGTIPNSRGDITKVDKFNDTVECLNIIKKIVLEYKEDPDVVDTVLAAIENIKSRKSQFGRAYATEAEFPIVLYSLIVLAIEQSTSFLIAVTIQYIKDPESGNVDAALDKVAYNDTRSNLMYEQLVKFNEACAKGETDIVLNDVLKNGGKLREGFTASNTSELSDTGVGVNSIVINVGKAIGGVGKQHHPDKAPGSDCVDRGIVLGSADDEECVIDPSQSIDEGIVGIVSGGLGVLSISFKVIKCILQSFIPILRSIVYYYNSTKVKISEYASIQSQFIEANAYKLQYTSTADIDAERKARIIQKQLKWADRLKNISNRFAIDNKKAEKEAIKSEKEDIKKIKINEIEDQLPVDIVTKSALF